LNNTALAALKELRARCGGEAIGPVIRKASSRPVHSCRKWFEACLKKAAIEDFRYHDLRHTFATRLRRNGVPLEDIAVLLNHDIPELRMTKRYAHADMDRLHKAVATLVQTDTKTDTAPVVEFPKSVAV
jgi:integrase